MSTLASVHALTWLVIANLVGLALSMLLLGPQVGDLMVPITYGRLMPLHLNLQLYGWCGIPLVGLLLRAYRVPLPKAAICLGLWSGALVFGAVSWLAGFTSGKLFLDWTGAARLALVLAMTVLALALIGGRWWSDASRMGRLVRIAVWLPLAAVPAIFYFAARPEVYPPINPDSGGATGGSLLGSSLGVVVILLLTPFLLGRRPHDGGRLAWRLGALLALHFAIFLGLDHGQHSHHEPVQVLALASLALWPPLLARHMRCFAWLPGDRRWLGALAFWGGLLVASGIATFLPGILEAAKFTHFLVAHAHLAMGGLVTALGVLILRGLDGETKAAPVFVDPQAFVLWNGGLAAMLIVLTGLGTAELGERGLLWSGFWTVDLAFALRALAGAAMTWASFRWLRAALSYNHA